MRVALANESSYELERDKCSRHTHTLTNTLSNSNVDVTDYSINNMLALFISVSDASTSFAIDQKDKKRNNNSIFCYDECDRRSAKAHRLLY